MIQSMTRSAVALRVSEFWEKMARKTMRQLIKTPITDARRPPKISDTNPTIIPPGIIPTEYSAAIRLA